MKIDKIVYKNGLTRAEVYESRCSHGENVLTPPARISLWKLYIEKYNDPIIKILLVAAAISFVFAVIEQEFIEVIGIFIAIILATSIGFYFERDAAKKFDMLTALGEEQLVKVVRDGRVQQIVRREVVVGDVVLLEVGDEVPADGQLFESTDLQIDESALTGEPLADKREQSMSSKEGIKVPNTSPIEELGDAAYPADMVLRSTMVMNGCGRMVVTAVGDNTEIGKVSRQATEMTSVKTPLNIQLDRLAGLISKVGSGVAIAAFIGFLGHDILINDLWHTDDYLGMAHVALNYFMMAVTLIVMAVPEGLPMAVTLALALNMRRMLKSNNLVRKLHACETMGAVTVICTDKTGTLTQNKMSVQEMYVADHETVAHLESAIALNSTAELDGDKGIGNPTETALLLWIKSQGKDYKLLRHGYKVIERMPFSTERKMMATVVDVDGENWLFVKGAPEIVMSHCDITEQQLNDIQMRLLGYQQKAMRTLAFAYKKCDSIDLSSLTFQGIAAISDPLRQEVPGAIHKCGKAGIDVKIVTGDTSATAIEIARQIGINVSLTDGSVITGVDFEALSDDEAYQMVKKIKVMCRARPTDKQRLVVMLQKHGDVVAVTGDGTNDAPALNHAHVGLSLGSGTSVAKNASDMTLIDDSFNSIVRAVEWGRSLYRNIQRFIFFQLVVNVTALLLVLGGSFVGTELPLTITQMLWVNLIMDTFAAMALASLPSEPEVMRERPRNQSDFIITPLMAWSIAVVGMLFFAVMITLLYYYEIVAGITPEELTIFFTVFVMLQWWNLFNAKSFASKHSAFRGVLKDRGLLFVLLIILVGQWIIVTFGGKMFRTVPLDYTTWLLIIFGTSPVMFIGELVRLFRKR